MIINLKRGLNVVFRKFGFQITRFPNTKPVYNALSLQSAIARIKSRPIEIETVIDVGASDGRWSRLIQQYFPKAFYFLIEANQYHEETLKKFTREGKRADYIIAAAGDSVGEINFAASNPFGGVATHLTIEEFNDSNLQSSQSIPKDHFLKVPSTTIDTQVYEKQLPPPYFLKLDTHGFEVPILNGAEETLKQTNLIVVETYNFNLNINSLRFYELCCFLDAKGFRPIDICDPLHRSKDNIFWQADLFFMPSNRSEFQNNTFS